MLIFALSNNKDMNTKIKDGIFELLTRSYKKSNPAYINVHGEYVTILDNGIAFRYLPYAAKKILAKYPQIRMVHFTGGWTEHVYSRETLKWMAI